MFPTIKSANVAIKPFGEPVNAWFYKKLWSNYQKNYFITSGAQLTGKSVNRNDTDTKKSALGDIKNAQTAGEQELSVKKVQIEIIDEENENEFASSEDVDYHLVWAEKYALSDDEINSWITMLNIARNMNPNEETEPPPPIPEEEITFQSCKFLDFRLFSYLI